jgi:hypothetical protein
MKLQFQEIKFGKNIILLDKLYYKNILSIKDKRMHSVEHRRNPGEPIK